MVDLVWHDFYSIGLEFLDNDHKQLLRIMQDVESAVSREDFQECSKHLVRLESEARAHFKREEEYLASVNYPDLEDHVKYHNELIEQADVMRRICEGILTKHDMRVCFDSMASFLIDDVLKGDSKFKSYLEYHGYLDKK